MVVETTKDPKGQKNVKEEEGKERRERKGRRREKGGIQTFKQIYPYECDQGAGEVSSTSQSSSTAD